MRAPAVFLLALVAAGCSHPAYDYRAEPDPRKREFVIGPADVIKITVWKNAELSTEARVRPDGTITMPLVGDLRAAGRTPTELHDEVIARLTAYLQAESRNVTIAVAEVNSYRFTVAGNVERTGVFAPRNYVTVSEAIALAGGLNRFASPSRILLIRGDHPARRIPIDFTRIATGEHPEENLPLLPGDTLYVP